MKRRRSYRVPFKRGTAVGSARRPARIVRPVVALGWLARHEAERDRLEDERERLRPVPPKAS
jgi:hypothetical protein